MKLEHYEKYIGNIIKVRLSWAVNERKNFLGMLKNVSDEEIVMEVDQQKIEFPFNAVKRANLIYNELI